MQAAALLTALLPQTGTAARSGATGDAAVDAPDFGQELVTATARADEHTLPVVAGGMAPVAGRATPRASIFLDRVPDAAQTPTGARVIAHGSAPAATSRQENIPPNMAAAPPASTRQDPDATRPQDPFRVMPSTRSVLSTREENSLGGATMSTDTHTNIETKTQNDAVAIPSLHADETGFTDPLHALPQRLVRLASNGVETVRIDLDIASADPVEVRMTLEGHQVRVDLTSDNPHLRERLEESLPAVAAALHSAGLKLVDGSVHARLTDAPRAAGPSQGSPHATEAADVEADPIPYARDASAAHPQDAGRETADARLDGMSSTNDRDAQAHVTLRGSVGVSLPEPRFDPAAASPPSAGETSGVTSGHRTAPFAEAGADRMDRTEGTPTPPNGLQREAWAARARTQILSSGQSDLTPLPAGIRGGQATAAASAEPRIAADRRADVRPKTPTPSMPEAVAARTLNERAPTEVKATPSAPIVLQQSATGAASSSAHANPSSSDTEASETVRVSTNVDEVAPTRAPTRPSGPTLPAPAPAADAAHAADVLETRDTSMQTQRATQINVRPVRDEGTDTGAAGASGTDTRTESPGWREAAISPRESMTAPAARAALAPTLADWLNAQALPAAPNVAALMGVVPEARAQRAGSPPSANDSPRAAGRAAASRRETLQPRTDAQAAATSPLPAVTAQAPTAVPGPPPAGTGNAFNMPARTPDMAVAPPSREPDMSGAAAGPMPAATADTTFSAALELAGSALPEFMLRETLESPEFVPALSARVATLVRDGIEEARIQLNPAEMGPVAVQLALEGSNVRVDLAAEMESTRQILEQSLPSLASALRESGFTLTGGGVFQQSRDSGGDDRGQARSGQRASGRTSNESVTTVTPAGTNGTSHRGLVDLYA